MTRGHGKRTQRGAITPDSPEGHDIGLSERQLGTASPIPGGAQHLIQPVVERQEIPIPAYRPEFRGVMTHGVPAEKHTAHERAQTMRGPNSTHDPQPVYQEPAPTERPVPVYVVSRETTVTPLISTSHNSYTVPGLTATNAEPIRLCGRNPDRLELHLLNESATHGVRFDLERSGLTTTGVGGTLLPAGMSNYYKSTTQDELYALSNDGTAATVSVIEVFAMPRGRTP